MNINLLNIIIYNIYIYIYTMCVYIYMYIYIYILYTHSELLFHTHASSNRLESTLYLTSSVSASCKYRCFHSNFNHYKYNTGPIVLATCIYVRFYHHMICFDRLWCFNKAGQFDEFQA